MSKAITFDTLVYANKLKNVGVPDKQAEVHAATMAQAINEQNSKLATKHDLIVIKNELINIMQVLEKTLEYRLIIKMGLMLAGAATIIVSIIALIVKL
jgi:hypothetical protein